MTEDTHGRELVDEHWDDADLRGRSFSACTFRRCSLVGAGLDGVRFEQCTFVGCNLSNADLTNAALQDVSFEDCKLVGLDFGRCRRLLFTVRFTDSDLSYGLFRELDLRGTSFDGSRLRSVAFAGCNLARASFRDAELSGATFERCDLREADFREARDYALDLADNRVEGARFGYPGVLALLAPFELDIEV